MELGPPPPLMKNFKEFLLSLDDSVDETEAVKRYNEYKMDFRRQQMQDFFLAHKDEEWYDPSPCCPATAASSICSLWGGLLCVRGCCSVMLFTKGFWSASGLCLILRAVHMTLGESAFFNE